MTTELEKIDISGVKKVVNLAIDGLLVDGGHHKQWYLEEILKTFGVNLNELQKECEFEKGIAP
jgi:hypothetical protein